MQQLALINRRSWLAARRLWALSIVALLASHVHAQSKWELTPYHVAIWIAAADPADLNGEAEANLYRDIATRAGAYMGAPWTLQVESAPADLAGEIVVRLNELTFEPALSNNERAMAFDKVMLVRLSRSEGEWTIAVREFDTQTYQLSPPVVHTAANQSQLAQGVLTAALEAFSPLVLLDKIDGPAASGRLRAGALAVEDASAVLVDPGDVLIPVVRLNDRLGRASPQAVRAVDWTVLEVGRRDGGKLQCQIYSAQRNPLASRARLRLVRYALAVQPPPRSTTLILQTPGDEPTPLVDYEIVEKNAATGAVEALGRTDPAGRLEVPWVDKPWRQLYVRHGEQLLARLPLAPGWRERLIVPLANDDTRLAAESVVSSLKQEVIDTVARRQIVAARFRERLSAGEFDDAEKMLAEFRHLSDHREFERRLAAVKADHIADNARAQQHIDALFAETQQVLRRYLDPQELQRMESQLAQARQGG